MKQLVNIQNPNIRVILDDLYYKETNDDFQVSEGEWPNLGFESKQTFMKTFWKLEEEPKKETDMPEHAIIGLRAYEINKEVIIVARDANCAISIYKELHPDEEIEFLTVVKSSNGCANVLIQINKQ